jgi:arylsulfatase
LLRKGGRFGALALLGIVAPILFVLAHHRSSPPSNVLLITVDTLRADHLGCYGYSRPTSPNIDALARNSVVFEDAHCQVPKTNPSLASLFSGLYPQNHKDLRLRLTLPSSVQTLAGRLAAAGWNTAGIVGQFNLVRRSGLAQGFETYIDDFPHASDSAAPGRFRTGSEKRAEDLTDLALGWLKDHSDSRFFLWIHYVDPHAPYDPPPPFDTSMPSEGYPNTVLERAQIHDQAFDPPHYDLAHYERRYDGAIRYVDEHIGRLLAGLARLGVERRTLVVFTADHGEAMGDPDAAGAPHFSHGSTLSEGETHVPLIFHLPADSGGSPTRRVRGPVEMVDVAPTVLSILGLAPLPSDGESLEPAFATGRAKSPFAFSYSFESNSVSLEDSRWKLVYSPAGSLAEYFNGRGTFRSITESGRARLYDRASAEEVSELSSAAGPLRTRILTQRLLDLLSRSPGPRDPVHYPVNEPWEETELLHHLRALGYLR